MKFNWGTGIVIFFILFAAGMTCAVVATTRHPPQLVQKDYYALDLNYQQRLEKKQNAGALATPPRVFFEAASQQIQVRFPEGMVAQTGAAKCYRPSTAREDFTVPLANAASLDIPAEGLTAGRWHIELDWEDIEGKAYFWETAITVQ